MEQPRIVNLINFIRAADQREPGHDLLDTLARQIDLVQRHGLAATWLLEFDALADERYTTLLRERLDTRQEVGLWLEVVQALTERAGVAWRGHGAWDPDACVGFTLGYTPAERERLADAAVAGFKEVFGYSPRVAGSWYTDAHTLGYLADRHGLEASCNCKDQWGTDGYTLWGGYWGQGYYPSRRNAFQPAQSVVEQIPAPVFRMLGSDPIEQYDLSTTGNGQLVATLEPVYPEGGGSPAWVRWFFHTNFEAPCLAFAYAQAGQENSFRWELMHDGLADQCALIAEWARAGRLQAWTLGETGRWYRQHYPLTPATAITALEDWRDAGRRTVWYNGRHYRTNLFWQDGHFRVRDLHLFSERYPEPNLVEPCVARAFTVDGLPLLDGYRWSGTGEPAAGLRLVTTGPTGEPRELTGGQPEVTEEGPETLRVAWPLTEGGTLTIRLDAQRLTFQCDHADWALAMNWSAAKPTTLTGVSGSRIDYVNRSHPYALVCVQGSLAPMTGQPRLIMRPAQGTLVLQPTDAAD